MFSMKRVGWCIAVRVGKRFMIVPSTTRTNRGRAIDDFVDIVTYKRQKRQGEIKTVAVYVNSADLRD